MEEPAPKEALSEPAPPVQRMDEMKLGRFDPRLFGRRVFEAAIIIAVPLVFIAILGTYQSVRPAKIASEKTPKDAGMETFEEVGLTTADGIFIAGWFVPAKTPSGAAVLVLHGYPADKSDLLDRAAFLHERYDLLFIDFRYFGKSGGSYSTVGAREVEDALAAIAELERRGIERIGVYGFSMGGAVALTALDRTDAVDAVVAEAPYADLRLIGEEPYRYLGPFRGPAAWLTGLLAKLAFGVDVDKVSPEASAARTDVPVLLIHSKKDKVIPFIHAERIQAALKDDPNAEFFFPEGLAHGEASVEFAKRVDDFFAKHLVPPPAVQAEQPQ